MTMEISYERDWSGAYMILPAGQDQKRGYELPMILENTIRGFLPVQRRQDGLGESYCYRISSLISLSEYLEHHALAEAFLKQLIFSLCQAVTELSEYLLNEEYLLLSLETIFVQERQAEPFSGTVLFCLCPSRRQNIKQDLRELLKCLMEKTDRTEDRCAVMCYELYGLVQKDNFCLREFMDAMERWAIPVSEEMPEKKKRTKQLFASGRNGGIMKRTAR